MFFGSEDRTFSQIREKSVQQWLLEMSEHEDIAVRSGVRATTDYIASLRKKIEQLEQKNQLKDEYLKKLKEKSKEK